MREAWPLLAALTVGGVLAWREYTRRMRQHLRPYFMTGTVHWRAHRGKRIDQK